MVYEVHVTLNRKFYSNIVVTALLSSDGNEYASGRVPFDDVATKVIQLKVLSQLPYYTLCLKKTAPFCFGNNLVECQPISTVFGKVTHRDGGQYIPHIVRNLFMCYSAKNYRTRLTFD